MYNIIITEILKGDKIYILNISCAIDIHTIHRQNSTANRTKINKATK